MRPAITFLNIQLSNSREYQQKVAVAISKGIENYLNEEAESAKKP